MDREPTEARFCAECNRCHSAEEGDLWAESSMLGLRITYFACMDGKVYDITGEGVNQLYTFIFFQGFLRTSWLHCNGSRWILSRCCYVFQSGPVARE